MTETNEYGQLVKGLRRRPLTAETRVRFPYWLSDEAVRNLILTAFFVVPEVMKNRKHKKVPHSSDAPYHIHLV